MNRNASAVEAVRSVYDRLAELVRLWQGSGPTDPGAAAMAEPLLRYEARLLDDRRADEWLDRWSPDGVLWVPLDPHAHPDADQSYYLDDLRRLRERVTWARQPNAWSQQPALQTVRVIANVEAIAGDDGTLAARSTLTLWEQRGTTRYAWAGHQLHCFGPAAADGGRRIEAKILSIPALRGAVPHPGVLL